MVETTGNRKMQIHTTDKPFTITRKQVYEAYKAVKSNAGSAGVDGQTIEQFDSDLRNNLYKLWNRMSSGSYFPSPVRAVSIPKKTGGAADFRCAYRSGSRGPDGCQTAH
jgi:RNA-directed DNA polymerase